MSASKDKRIILDGPYADADFSDPKWLAHTKRELGLSEESAEFSARARKKKRIYKRKKSDPKPSA